jgi:hypothetical protein
VRTCDEVWLDKRGDNDSFMDRGFVKRLALAVDGYIGIGAHYFGGDSVEVGHIRRVLRWELGFPTLMNAKQLTHNKPELESWDDLRRIVDNLDLDQERFGGLRRAVFERWPASSAKAAGRAYSVYARLRQLGRLARGG